MHMSTRVLLALDGNPSTVIETATALGAREVIVRRCLTSLIDRVLVRATRQHPYYKRYELTTLGKMEADRLRPKALELAWAAPVEPDSHPLAMAWGGQA